MPLARPQAAHPPAAEKALKTPVLPLGALLFGFALSPAAHAAEEPVKTLTPVQVTDSAEKPSAANSYQGQTTKVGKLKQLPKDVPQGLTIVTEKLMEDRNQTTLKDALSNVAGLTFNAGEGGRIGDNMNLRGFYSFGDLYMDGIRDTAQYNRDTFNLQQVDVLRGSGSMLFGRGQAGGVINQVSKEAMLYDINEVSTTIGTHDYKRVTADVNRALSDTAAFRVNLMKTDAGSTRDFVRSERDGFAPTLRWGIGTANEFSISHFYLKTHNTPDYGVPFYRNRPLGVSANTFYGTRYDYEDNDTNMTTGSYTHRFDDGSELKSVLRFANYVRDLWAAQPQLRTAWTSPNACSGTVTNLTGSSLICRSIKARGAEEDTITSQTDYTTKFSTGSLKHEALVGMEFLKENLSRWSYSTTGIAIPATTVSNPDASAPGLGVMYGHTNRSAINRYRGDSRAFYAQDSIEFIKNWKMLVGVRQDELRADYETPTSGYKLHYAEKSYRSGLMYQPTDESSYYLAWNDSFNPTADLYQLDSSNAYKPERSRTTELGAKWELFDGNLSLRTAVYRATKFWERNTDLESTGGLLSKKRHTDGIELEAAGRITSKWEVFGGWTLMDSVIDTPGYTYNSATGAVTQHNANLKGMRPRNVPRYTYNLWSTYKLSGGWRIGAGMEGKGNRLAYGIGAGTTAITPNVAPSYNRVDAMIAYEQPKWSARLNVLNVFDKRYYESIYENGGHAVPGTERAIQLTTTFKF
ncbi:MAG: TonB-dependent receptor [Zoogloea sp.]|uniref:TonB-dependent receptor n=1 Tax=Zoogloea sp. TaxID=49181 RepID=UPI003F385DC1